MKVKRIAIMIWSLYGGGMEHVAAQLSIMLSRRGYEVFFFVLKYKKGKMYPHEGKVIAIPLKFQPLKGGRIHEGCFYLNAAYRVNELKRKNQIDLTISFAQQMNMINLLSGNADRKIFTIHSCLSERKDCFTWVYRKPWACIFNFADVTVAVSDWVKKDLLKNYNVKKDKVKTIYNPAEIVEERVDVNVDNVVLTVGSLRDVKQQWHIIRAFKEVVKCIPDAELWIAGEGNNKKYFKCLARELGLEEKINFLGFVKDMRSIYLKVKIVVFSSASEALPCSVIEAISYGLPVVAADCPGGIHEIIAPSAKFEKGIADMRIVEAGILTPVLDGKKYNASDKITDAERKLAEGIKLLLLDQEQYDACKKGCFKAAEKFSWDRIENEWMKTIFEVTGEKQIV